MARVGLSRMGRLRAQRARLFVSPAERDELLGLIVSVALTASIGALVTGAANIAIVLLSTATLVGIFGLSSTFQPPRPRLEEALTQLDERTRRGVIASHEIRLNAEDARRRNEEFMAAVSHELRTPLNSIQGFSEVLLSELDGKLTDSQREDIQTISNAGRFLKELIDEVLNISLRRSVRTEDLPLVDIAQLIRETARMLEGQLRTKPIDLEVDLPELPAIRVDARRIRQVLINLGTNAIAYTQQGKVRFGATLNRHEILIRVEDTGVGIAEADLSRIFRAYERVGDNRGKVQGWGLGLAIAREMAQWHGGNIEAHSVPGQGSIFTVRIPIRAPR